MNRSSIHRWLIALLVVLGGSLTTWILLGRPSTGIDDADIFFVYARHFAGGDGFVYNVGGEHVEGFTSLLWTLICSVFYRFTDSVEIPLYLLNVLIGVMVVGLIVHRTGNPLILIGLLASAPAWFAWSHVTLMESGLWCLLLTFLVLAVAERHIWLMSVLLPLLVLTRPEAMLWGGWLLLVSAFVFKPSHSREGPKSVVVPAMLFLAALAGLIIFRLHYFGYPVPNTYYAKVSPGLFANIWSGAGYLLRYLLFNPVHLLVAATWLILLVRTVREWKNGFSFSGIVALCLLPGIGIPVLVGGDHFGGFRFYQPLWPLLCLLAADEWVRRFAGWSRKKWRVILALLVVCGWGLFPATSRLEHEFRIAASGRTTGRVLSEMFSGSEVQPEVATITAGGIKLAYDGPVLDLMGLNSTEMAHAPGPRSGFKNHAAFNRDLFYAWAPDILLCGEDPAFDYKVLKGLTDDERFRQLYVKMELHRHGQHLTAYYSHAFLEQVYQY
ncbi:MAG: hypothetical protein JXR25_11420 [Pontiellaceae bacterium]|nr:hypothetical protein [Pontiellaceae bacterium]MBN2785423.1 hypothetical protein [Pontiellaceae bacterium]